jgi:hypothetical protein
MELRGVTVAVPESAKARLDALNVEVSMALDAQRALQGRANQVEPGTDLHERLIAERDKQGQKHRTLHRLLSSLNQFIFQLRLHPGEALRPVKTAATLKKGETAAEAVGKLRLEMFSISQELAKLRMAPLPAADQIALAEAYVARKAMVAAPKVVIQRDTLNLVWSDDVITSKTDLITMLAWLAPKTVLSAVRAEIEAAPEAANAMPAADRDAKIAALSAQLLVLERREVALLDESTLPRPDTSPLAYLQVAIVAMEAATAAA